MRDPCRVHAAESGAHSRPVTGAPLFARALSEAVPMAAPRARGERGRSARRKDGNMLIDVNWAHTPGEHDRSSLWQFEGCPSGGVADAASGMCPGFS